MIDGDGAGDGRDDRRSTPSLLTAAGQASTPDATMAWISMTVASVRTRLGSSRLEAHLWGYREPEDAIALDVWSPVGSMPLTFRIADRMDVSDHFEVLVPDLIEALHVSGLILSALGVTPRVGRGANGSHDRQR